METPTLQGPVDEKWLKLVTKIGQHPKGKNLILLPEEAVLLRKKMGELTKQLFHLAGFVQKYQPLLATLERVSKSAEASDALGVTDSTTEAEPAGASESTRGDDGVDPEDLHNTLTPEPIHPVAPHDGWRPAYAIVDEVAGD